MDTLHGSNGLMCTNSYAHNEKASGKIIAKYRGACRGRYSNNRSFCESSRRMQRKLTDPVTGEARLVTISCHPVIQCRSPGRQIIGEHLSKLLLPIWKLCAWKQHSIATMGCPFNMYGREGNSAKSVLQVLSALGV